jgi:hypothetical protein
MYPITAYEHAADPPNDPLAVAQARLLVDFTVDEVI